MTQTNMNPHISGTEKQLACGKASRKDYEKLYDIWTAMQTREEEETRIPDGLFALVVDIVTQARDTSRSIDEFMQRLNSILYWMFRFGQEAALKDPWLLYEEMRKCDCLESVVEDVINQFTIFPEEGKEGA